MSVSDDELSLLWGGMVRKLDRAYGHLDEGMRRA